MTRPEHAGLAHDWVGVGIHTAGPVLLMLTNLLLFQKPVFLAVNEHHIPVYNPLVALRLTDQRLRLTLTRTAADAWGLRSATMTIKLSLDPTQIDTLRTALRRVFANATTHPPGGIHL
jgi:hypothetical protein